ncbi:DUF5690 family protein [Sphingobacterium psychroaquaticum]|nr:DUF5690 family protein [Sphingobacterium psychroaquaticum]
MITDKNISVQEFDMDFTQRLKQRLLKMDEKQVAILLAITAFLCYTSMYAFRKSFTASTYSNESIFGIDYKVCLIICQMLGYLCAKFYGIKFIAESKNQNKGRYLAILITISWIGLLGFAVLPNPWNALLLLVNGFPLGMVWGLVFSYLEGRRYTEIMGAVMSVSLIFASGFIKTVGRWMIASTHVNEYWMPFLTGLIFFLPFMACVWVLENSPPPTARDKAMRTERVAMNGTMRKQFFKTFMPGIVMTIVIYTMLTMLRDVRDNFEVEIWHKVTHGEHWIFAQVDTFIALTVLWVIGSLIRVKDNLKAFKMIHGLIICGFLLAGVSTYLFSIERIGGLSWMVLVGLGLYLAYIPYNAIFFERMIATYGIKSNIGFVMYLADSFGYLGSFLILLNKELLPNTVVWSNYFTKLVYIASIVGSVLALLSWVYFVRKKAALHKQNITTESPSWCPAQEVQNKLNTTV